MEHVTTLNDGFSATSPATPFDQSPLQQSPLQVDWDRVYSGIGITSNLVQIQKNSHEQ